MQNKCLLCDETRGIQKCHIISRKLDYVFKWIRDNGETLNFNLLFLCPNHHFYFDKGLLTNEEKDKVEERIFEMFKEFCLLILDLRDKYKEDKERMELIGEDFEKTAKHYMLRNKTFIQLKDKINNRLSALIT